MLRGSSCPKSRAPYHLHTRWGSADEAQTQPNKRSDQPKVCWEKENEEETGKSTQHRRWHQAATWKKTLPATYAKHLLEEAILSRSSPRDKSRSRRKRTSPSPQKWYQMSPITMTWNTPFQIEMTSSARTSSLSLCVTSCGFLYSLLLQKSVLVNIFFFFQFTDFLLDILIHKIVENHFSKHRIKSDHNSVF